LFQAKTDEKAGHRREATWMKTAIETFKLNLLAYPDSDDAHFNLADAYLKDGLKDLAREYAEKALAPLDWHTALKVLQNPHLRKRVGREWIVNQHSASPGDPATGAPLHQ
jgi:tetratricopeptide (TPR) repeat protein